MIHAYDNQYLDDAMKCLGEAFDYAANACEMDMDRFLDLFIVTGYAEQFAAGVPGGSLGNPQQHGAGAPVKSGQEFAVVTGGSLAGSQNRQHTHLPCAASAV